jgi:heat shock protein HslJ
VTAQAPDQPPALGDTEWTLVELDGEPVEVAEGERAPHLVLDLEESRIAGSGGINRLMGTFSLSASELRFGPIATTMMAGPEREMAREHDFLAALARVTSYELKDRTLTLRAGDDVVSRLSS